MKKLMMAIGIFALFFQSALPACAQEDVKEEMTDVDIEEKVDKIMEEYIGKEIPGASIGIVKDGKVILTKGYGVSDIQKKVPVTADETVFELASVTKVFTWSMLMKLAEDGKVKLDADIQEYLPEGTLDLSFNKKITILNLMSHTAGFEEKIEGMDLNSVDQIKPLKETVTKENQPKQIYEPGTVTAYSNYGTNVGGYIIEQVTGKDYMEYMNQFVHEQLQMNRSSFSMISDDQPAVIRENKSLGYLYDGSKFEDADPYGGLTNDFPAGALQSTTTDMTNFMLALLNNDGKAPYTFFEKTETLRKLQAHSHGIVPGALGNAHGFWEEEVAGKRIIGHGGNSGGFSSQLTLVPEEGLGYILLTNVAGEATGIRDDLKALLIGRDSSATDLALKKSPTDKKVTGRYRMGRNMESTLAKVTYIVANFDMVVTENKDGGIRVKGPLEKEGVLYVETKSGIYQKVDKESTDKYLYFKLDSKDQVVAMGNGMVTDSIPVSFMDTQLVNFVIFGSSFLAFLGSLFYLLIKFIRQKRKKQATSWSWNDNLAGAFAAVGLVVMLNAVGMIIKFATNLTIEFSSMQLLFYINWLLPVSTIVMGAWLTFSWRKSSPKWLLVFLVLIGVLVSVQFYNVHLFF